MKIIIKSRNAIEKLSVNQFPKKTALISVTDYGCDFADLKNTPDYLLQLSFDDVDSDVFMDELGRKPSAEERKIIEEKYHMLSDKQTEQIVDFYRSVCDKADYLICQCEHGQSRSAAIAAAILEYRSRNGIMVFANEKYYPNKTVFNKILNGLKIVV